MQSNSARSNRSLACASKSFENPEDLFCPKFERMRLQSSPASHLSPKGTSSTSPNRPYAHVFGLEQEQAQARDPYARSQYSAQSDLRLDQQYYRSRDSVSTSNSPHYSSQYNQSRLGKSLAPYTGPLSPQAAAPACELDRGDRVAAYSPANSSRGGRLRVIPPKILALGDSFIGPLTLFSTDAIRVVKIKGASARGLAKDDSTTGAKKIALEKLQRYTEELRAYAAEEDAQSPPHAVLLVFGTVDLQVNVYYRLAHEHKFNTDRFVTESVERYSVFLKQLLDQLRREPEHSRPVPVVCSAFLPVVAADYLLESLKRYLSASVSNGTVDRIPATKSQPGANQTVSEETTSPPNKQEDPAAPPSSVNSAPAEVTALGASPSSSSASEAHSNPSDPPAAAHAPKAVVSENLSAAVADPASEQSGEQRRELRTEAAASGEQVSCASSDAFLQETDREDSIVLAVREYSEEQPSADAEAERSSGAAAVADEAQTREPTQENELVPAAKQESKQQYIPGLSLDALCEQLKLTSPPERVRGASGVQSGAQSRAPPAASVVRDPSAKIEVPRPPEHVHPELDAKLDELFAANPEVASLGWRELLVSRFNRALMKKCKQLGLQFLDVNFELRERTTGHIAEMYRDRSHTNIHIMWEETVPFWVKRLEKYGLCKSDLRKDLDSTSDQYRRWKNRELDELARNTGFRDYDAMANAHSLQSWMPARYSANSNY